MYSDVAGCKCKEIAKAASYDASNYLPLRVKKRVLIGVYCNMALASFRLAYNAVQIPGNKTQGNQPRIFITSASC